MRKLKTFAPLSMIILLINILIINACVSETRKAAEQKMNQASGLILSGEFERGMALLDSIPVWFPEEYGIVGKALILKKEAASAYHQEFISHAQIMLDGFTLQVDELSRNFIFSAGPAGRSGTYEHKRQTVRRSWNRIFLKTNLTEDGQFWLSSHYYGSEWIDHYCIKVYDKELYLFSDTISLNDPNNRKIEDGTDRWEKIDFRDGADKGIVGLIIQNQDRRLKVRFTGKKHYYIVMESFDKKAVKEGYELAQVLKEVYELKQKIGQHKKELRLLGVSNE